MSMMTPKFLLAQRLADLRAELDRRGLDGFVIPRFDEHQGEYCAPHDNRLAFLTGFTGSAGVAAVFRDRAALFVDGRYQVQVREETDTGLYAIEHFHQAPLKDWLARTVKPGERIGFNPMLIPHRWDSECGAAVRGKGGEWLALESDPVDAIWHDQPDRPLGAITPMPVDHAGMTSVEKRRLVAERLRALGADLLIEAQPDNIAWLLNVRGRDVAFNPMPNSFLVASSTGAVEWMVDSRKLPNDLAAFELEDVTRTDPEHLLERIGGLAAGRRAVIDPDFAPAAFSRAVEQKAGTVLLARSPLTEIKMVKNEAELSGFRTCHQRDGLAWVRFLAWLEAEVPRREAEGNPVTELEAEARILAFRNGDPLFVEPSFRSISAAGGHAAMCHYAAAPETDAPLSMQQVYLLDSGGQYRCGTTDATRTTAFAPVSAEIRRAYTAVLKGLISMLSLQFPRGTRGHQLDAFARRALWAEGLDYDHGTGHGVGHFLSVHEQAQRFDKRVNDVDIEAGMVTTVEPGHYEAGVYGIRLENQVEVVEGRHPGFLAFRSLTLIPLDLRLADMGLLSLDEIRFLNGYHMGVRRALAPDLDGETLQWLLDRTEAVPLPRLPG
ncbi:aminopeptidase P family protein [Gellertiella hungarica]|uniref:Xaa-Pro aminopeptidase n=1 Tax=Gellertiella hungarica TaxID=1572859 RepID=A0A7W6NIX3_9HYPH|nr:aminopeptidase P family protein [Gellertiella hungarica]MBB4062859.1 Xaa-Pro aminopeptidase [Gellertiella hungarica]